MKMCSTLDPGSFVGFMLIVHFVVGYFEVDAVGLHYLTN